MSQTCLSLSLSADTIPKSRRIFDLIRKLTCNRLEGEASSSRISKQEQKLTPEEYIRSKSAAVVSVKKNKKLDVDEFLETVASGQLQEKDIAKLLAGVVGWPGFRDVFTVSATEG